MLIENIELTMSHVGLGNLNEYALMILFGNAHSHHLTRGLNHNPSQIRSMVGDELYPAYFMTQLRVPLTRLLPSYKLWQTVDVGVDVKRFGETLLESTYAIADGGALEQDSQAWNNAQMPTMVGNNLIVVEHLNGATAKRQVANPSPDSIAELVKTPRAPKGLMLSKKVRTNGFDDFPVGPQFQTQQPITYSVKPGRDALDGHALIFAKYVQLMDVIEHDFLKQQLQPALSDALLARLEVLERDIYYYGNCYADEELAFNLCGEIELVQDGELVDELNFIPAAYLVVNFEIYQKRTNTLLVMARVKKVFAVPMKEQENISDLRRLVNQYSRL